MLFLESASVKMAICQNSVKYKRGLFKEFKAVSPVGCKYLGILIMRI